MRMPRVVGRLALAAAMVSAGATAFADDDGHLLGAAVGYSTQFDAAVYSLDFLLGINRDFTIVPFGTFIYAGGIHRWSAGLELQWNVPIDKLHPRLLGWVGGGLSAITLDPKGPPDATTRDLVINAVAGVGWDAPASPFFQVRVTLKDPSDVGLSIGVRF
jgi:hypothetical protein